MPAANVEMIMQRVAEIDQSLADKGLRKAARETLMVRRRKYESARRFLELAVPPLCALLDVKGVSPYEVADDPTAASLDEAGIDGALFKATSGHGLFYASRTLKAEGDEPHRKSLRLAHAYRMPSPVPNAPNSVLMRLASPGLPSLEAGRDRDFAPATAAGHRRNMASDGFGRLVGHMELSADYGKNGQGQHVVNVHSEVSKILYHQDRHADTGSVVPNYHVTTWWDTTADAEVARCIIVVKTAALARLIWEIFDSAVDRGHYLFSETSNVGGLFRAVQSQWEPPYYLTESEFDAIERAIASGPYGNRVSLEQIGTAIFLAIDNDFLVSAAGARIWVDGDWQ